VLPRESCSLALLQWLVSFFIARRPAIDPSMAPDSFISRLPITDPGSLRFGQGLTVLFCHPLCGTPLSELGWRLGRWMEGRFRRKVSALVADRRPDMRGGHAHLCQPWFRLFIPGCCISYVLTLGSVSIFSIQCLSSRRGPRQRISLRNASGFCECLTRGRSLSSDESADLLNALGHFHSTTF